MGQKEAELLCPFRGGAGSPSTTMWPRLRSTSVPCGVFINQAIWPQQTWAKNWGGGAPYQVASWSIQPFCHNRQGPKIGGLCPLFGGGAGSLSSTMWPERRPTSTPSGILMHPAVWPQQIWAENWGCAPLGEGSWVPIEHNVARAEAYLHANFHLDPSIHLATVHQRHRQDRQRSDTIGIGWTVLQMITHKWRFPLLENGILSH